MKFPGKFYLAVISSFKDRGRGSQLCEPTWMSGSPAGYCHWTKNMDERTIFTAEGSPLRFVLTIHKSFQDCQKGSLANHPSWVYNAGHDGAFNYTSVEKEATVFRLVSVPIQRGEGYAFEVLQSFKNRGKGSLMGHKSWMYNSGTTTEDGAKCVFGYTSVESESTVFMICEECCSEPVQSQVAAANVVDISFDMSKAVLGEKSHTLLQATYTNKSDVELTLSTEQTKKTKKTRVFQWSAESSIPVGAKYTITCEVPFLKMAGKTGLDYSNTYLLGKENAEENNEKQEWSLPWPEAIPPKTSLTIEAVVTQGRLEVPFVATLKSGERQWEENGTLKSTNYFGLLVDCSSVDIGDASNSYSTRSSIDNSLVFKETNNWS